MLSVQQRFQEPVLGQIIEEKHTGPLAVLRSDDKRHSLFEAFRNLRSSLFYLPVEGERPKAFLITSSVPNEGKSTIAANLAAVIALSGARTFWWMAICAVAGCIAPSHWITTADSPRC